MKRMIEIRTNGRLTQVFPFENIKDFQFAMKYKKDHQKTHPTDEVTHNIISL